MIDGNWEEASNSRYEFRVWGSHTDAKRRLVALADMTVEERIDDCYLLTPDPATNIKIRKNRLKVKRLVSRRLGFERWANGRLPDAEDARPRPANADPVPGVADAIDHLGPAGGVHPLLVTKHRRRFRFGSMRAEITDLKVYGRPGSLSTTAIEGRNLRDLIGLRSSLGFDFAPNLAVHLAIDPRCESGQVWPLVAAG